MAEQAESSVNGQDAVTQVPNAFAGRKVQPTDAELEAALGRAMAAWQKLIATLTDACDISVTEWRCYSVKAGWSMRLMRRKRTIVWLSPCARCFQVTFILGARALVAARQSGLSAAGIEALDRGVKYPEGTCIRLLIKSAKALEDVKKLAVAKTES